MRFAAGGEEHKYLAANEFIQELKKAPEWMIHTNLAEGVVVLRVRDRPMSPWKEYYSPNLTEMAPEDFHEFEHAVETIADMRRQDRLHDKPEQPNH